MAARAREGEKDHVFFGFRVIQLVIATERAVWKQNRADIEQKGSSGSGTCAVT